MTPSKPKYDFRIEEDPESGDPVLILPEDFLADEGWQVGDTLKLETAKRGTLVIENKSKRERNKTLLNGT